MKTFTSMKKSRLSVTIMSVIFSLGVASSCYAKVNGAQQSQDGRSGSFSYIDTTGKDNSICPGPYESLALTFVNHTDGYNSVSAGYAMAYNVYMVIDDHRKYTGKFAYQELDQKLFHFERPTAEEPNYLNVAPQSSAETYGPIIGVGITGPFGGFSDILQVPIHAGDGHSKIYANGDAGLILDYLSDTYGKDNVEVMTFYTNKVNKRMDMTSFNGDISNYSPVTLTVKLPVRSYKRLLIVPVATKIGPGNLDQVRSSIVLDNLHPLIFDFQASSSTNGYLGTVTAYRPSEGMTTPASKLLDMRKLDSAKLGMLPLASFPATSTIDLRAVDDIVFTSKGRNDTATGEPVHLFGYKETTSDAEARKANPSLYFKGSDVSVNYLKNITTGNTINCN